MSAAIPPQDAQNTPAPEPSSRLVPESVEIFELVGAGVAVLVPMAEADAERWGIRRGVATWLHVGASGRVTVYTGKVEVGQNVRTVLAQVAAEELYVPIEQVRVVLGDTDLSPFDPGTFGSRSAPVMVPQVRAAAADAREQFLRLAAERWEVEPGTLTIANGVIRTEDRSQTIGYGELAEGRQLLHTAEPGAVKAVPPAQWKVLGHPAHKVNGETFLTGTHRYTSDIRRPGMRYGKVLRPSTFDATLKSLDTTMAEALPGVSVVRDGEFVGVVAPSTWQAEQALQAIRAEWEPGTALPAEKDLYQMFKPGATPGETRHKRDSDGDIHLAATYTVPYIAHAPLEPRAAVAEWDNGRLTVWTGTQKPFGVAEELRNTFGLSEEQARVIVPDTGSGYGGKHTGEAAIEAARLAKLAGVPVKLVWTREEEFTWAYFRPAGVIDIAATLNSDGQLTEWQHINYNSGGSGIACPYSVPEPEVEFREGKSPLRQGSYRALASTANNFARESHIDDLARAAAIDPLEFRQKNIQSDRLCAVLDAAASRFGWRSYSREPGYGIGLAVGTEKASYVATCTEVRCDLETGGITVLRLVTAFECGAILNPLHLENQVEGAVVMGLGGALHEAIHFANGTITNPRFSEYRVPRFPDMPQMEVVLVDRKDLTLVGAGETPIIAVAPAIRNAVLQAMGTPLYSLPLSASE